MQFVILVEGIIRNISLNYFEFVPLVQDMSFKTFLPTVPVAFLFGRAKPFMQFW